MAWLAIAGMNCFFLRLAAGFDRLWINSGSVHHDDDEPINLFGGNLSFKENKTLNRRYCSVAFNY